MKKILFNADDFGLAVGINDGIMEAFSHGVVKNASLIATGNAYNHAVGLARDNPELDIGIHLCLTMERPVLPSYTIPSLVAEDRFPKSHTSFILNYILGRVDLEDVLKEFDAQINRVLESGIIPSHIDSHGHIHMLPGILGIVIKLAKKYGIGFIRYPYERLTYIKGIMCSRILLNLGLNNMCLLSRQIFNRYDLLKIQQFYGFLKSGHISENYLYNIFSRSDFKSAEIACHIARSRNGLKCYSGWNYAWKDEFSTFTSPALAKLIERFDIAPVRFRDLL